MYMFMSGVGSGVIGTRQAYLGWDVRMEDAKGYCTPIHVGASLATRGRSTYAAAEYTNVQLGGVST